MITKYAICVTSAVPLENKLLTVPSSASPNHHIPFLYYPSLSHSLCLFLPPSPTHWFQTQALNDTC